MYVIKKKREEIKMANEKIKNMLTYVAQEMISPLCFSDKTCREAWKELSGEKFNELCKIAYSQEKINLIHAIVFTEDEYEYYKDEKYFCDCASGDYIVHCLVDVDKKHCITRNDNTHSDIESEIRSFIDGLEYAGYEVNVKYGLYIVPNNPYEINLFSENIKFIELSY